MSKSLKKIGTWAADSEAEEELLSQDTPTKKHSKMSFTKISSPTHIFKKNHDPKVSHHLHGLHDPTVYDDLHEPSVSDNLHGLRDPRVPDDLHGLHDHMVSDKLHGLHGKDDWEMGKKSATNKESLSLGGFGSGADNVDSWGGGKGVMSGSGFRDTGHEAFGGKKSGLDSSGKEMSSRGTGHEGFKRTRLVLEPKKEAGIRDQGQEPSERKKLVLNPKKELGSGPGLGPVKNTKASPFGAARPREEVLAEKGLDWKKLELEIEEKKSSSNSKPRSSNSSRSEGVGVEGTVKDRPKVNPFGDAKPREVLLQEKGLDWRKIDLDLDHRCVDRPETEEEKISKEEIEYLKRELVKISSSNASTESQGATAGLHNIILKKERELELLTRELDDKVRYRPRVNERPGSGAGRASGPPSWPESFEQSRIMEFMEGPRTHGTSDMWSRQSDDRRAFKGGTDRGFTSNRGMDRQSEDRRSFQHGMERGFMGDRGMERGFMGERGMDKPRSKGRW